MFIRLFLLIFMTYLASCSSYQVKTEDKSHNEIQVFERP